MFRVLSSTGTYTDTGNASTGWVKLGFVVNSAGTSVDFYVNDILAVTQTTNIPSTSLLLYGGMQAYNSASMRLDQMVVTRKFTGDRA